MIKRLLWVSMFFLMPFLVYGQDEGVFWKITGNGLREPSYLFGTIHLICMEDYHLSDEVVKKIQKADALILEVDMDDPWLALSMMAKMHNEGGEEITDYLTEEEYQETRRLLKERTGTDIEMLKSMRPLMLMSLIYPSLLECETKAYENELLKHAKEKNKEIYGLESIDEQLSIFDRIPLEEQYRSFYEYTGNLEKGKKEFRRLIETYKNEEIALLVKMVSESPEYRDYQDILLDQRNRNWIRPMREFMEKGSVFFAVGAGHLGGKSGIIQLLKSEGYELKRIPTGRPSVANSHSDPPIN
ncbi:TraB/GumN family protein [Negadavirga shengliensis]|uniref:TraB/GumN family protein n=1 Tax=Negadavirga shengliensis TaxID=1389218 RepID=A0ABV9SV12_9BACT